MVSLAVENISPGVWCIAPLVEFGAGFGFGEDFIHGIGEYPVYLPMICGRGDLSC
jgi:hypothetical protein